MFYGTIANFKLGILACCVKLFHKLWLFITTCFCTLHTSLQFELIITRVGFVCSLSLSLIGFPTWTNPTSAAGCTVGLSGLAATPFLLCRCTAPFVPSVRWWLHRPWRKGEPLPVLVRLQLNYCWVNFHLAFGLKGYPDRWVVEVEHHHKQQRETWATF